MERALDRKWAKAAKELRWQWLFPATNLTFVPDENVSRRYHLHQTQLQRALHEAVRHPWFPLRCGYAAPRSSVAPIFNGSMRGL